MSGPPAFDRFLLQRLADLARLHVPAERQAATLQGLQRVVEAFDALRELDPPTLRVDGTERLVLRADRAEPCLPLDEVLQNASRTAAGMFVVPRVVDG